MSEQRLRGRYWDPAGIANARICHSLVGCGQNYTCFEIYARVTSFSSSFLSLCLFLLSYVHTYLHRPPPPFLFPFFSDSCLILVRCFILHLPISHPRTQLSSPPDPFGSRCEASSISYPPPPPPSPSPPPPSTVASYPDSTTLPRRTSRAE